MDVSKIKILIEFVARSNITELSVTEKDTTVRIFRSFQSGNDGTDTAVVGEAPAHEDVPEHQRKNEDIGRAASLATVVAPIFGVLHAAPAPGEDAFVKLGDDVEAGQTLFIIEAMKVFNKITAPCAGRIIHLINADGVEVEAGDVLAEVA